MKVLHIESNTIYTQITPFQYVTADWNNDNDIYTLYGAYFKPNEENYNEFLTKSEILSEEYKILE